MKFLKYAMIALVLAVITDISLVAAYPTPSATQIGVIEIKKDSGVYSRWLTKNRDGLQTYENTFASTWLTSPCPNCIIGTIPYNESGTKWDGITTKMYQKKEFTHNISVVLDDPFDKGYNNYRIYNFRVDATLLTTNHAAEWTINPYN